MSSIELWIVVGFLFGLFVLGLVFLMSMNGRKRHKRQLKPLKEKEQRDWKEVALRLEKHIAEVRKENIGWQKQVRILQKEKDIYQEKCEELGLKLDREKVWQQKEIEDINKKNVRIKELENELKQIESRLESEHMQFVMMRRQDEELKNENEKQASTIRQLSTDMEKIRANADAHRKEILDLRAENKKLSQRHEDVQWIAKSVHLKVKEELRQAKEEIQKLSRKLNIDQTGV